MANVSNSESFDVSPKVRHNREEELAGGNGNKSVELSSKSGSGQLDVAMVAMRRDHLTIERKRANGWRKGEAGPLGLKLKSV